VGGCATATKAPPPAVTEDTRAQAIELAVSLTRAGMDVSTLAARGSLEYKASGSNHFFRFELISQRPSNFHFTIIDPLGRPAVRVISDGDRLMALEYGPAKATIGDAGSNALGSMMPVGFSPSDFISLLAASLIPLPADAELAPASDGKTRLRVTPGGNWEGSQWLVNVSQGPNGPRLDGFTATIEDEPPIVASYGQFEPQTVEDIGKTVDFPNRLDLGWGRDQSVLVRYEEVRLGFPAQPELFSTEVPKGFSQVGL
jgi:hypothetical protein